MGYKERKLRAKESLREKIISTALKIVKEQGSSAVTIRKIAAEIEYTAPIIYEFFESKDDLMKELVLTGFEILYKRFSDITKTETDPRKALRMLSISFWNFAFENSELYQLMFIATKPVSKDEMQELAEPLSKTFLSLTGNNVELAKNLMAHWMCLQNGTIAGVLGGQLKNIELYNEDPTPSFLSFIDRFINSI